MAKITNKQIERMYQKFDEKYKSFECTDHRIINQFAILKKGINRLYEEKNPSALKYMRNLDKQMSKINNAMGKPSKLSDVHDGIKEINKLLRQYLSELEKNIENQIKELENTENIDEEKVEELRKNFASRNFVSLDDKIKILNDCVTLSKELGDEASNINEQLKISEYGNEYVHKSRESKAREELASADAEMLAYETSLEAYCDMENAASEMKEELDDSIQYQLNRQKIILNQTGNRYAEEINDSSAEEIVNDIHYHNIARSGIEHITNEKIKNADKKRKLAEKIASENTAADSIELFCKYNLSEKMQDTLGKIKAKHAELNEQWKNLDSVYEELQNKANNIVNSFKSTINVNRDKEKEKALAKVDDKNRIFDKISSFIKQKTAGITGIAKSTKERFDAEQEAKEKLVNERINGISKQTGKGYSKLDVDNIKRRISGIFAASLMLTNGTSAFAKELNLDELTSSNITQVENVDYSRSYYTHDTSIKEYLNSFWEGETEYHKKYQEVVANMEYSERVKEMFAYNIQMYIENYETNAAAWGFDMPLEVMLDKLIASAEDVGKGVVTSSNIMQGAIAYTEGVGKDDSEKKIVLGLTGGYLSLLHEIEHTDQGIGRSDAPGVFDQLMCPNKFYHFLLEGDAQFVQLLGSDNIVDTGISLAYGDIWGQYNMLMQCVGANELHEYIQIGCKDEKFVDFVVRRFDEQGISKELAEEFLLNLQDSISDKFDYIYNEKEVAMSAETKLARNAQEKYKSYKNRSEQKRYDNLQNTTIEVISQKIKNSDEKSEFEKAIQDVAKFKLFSAENSIEISQNNILQEINYDHFIDAEKILEEKGLLDDVYSQYKELYENTQLDKKDLKECFDSTWECININSTIEEANNEVGKETNEETKEEIDKDDDFEIIDEPIGDQIEEENPNSEEELEEEIFLENEEENEPKPDSNNQKQEEENPNSEEELKEEIFLENEEENEPKPDSNNQKQEEVKSNSEEELEEEILLNPNENLDDVVIVTEEIEDLTENMSGNRTEEIEEVTGSISENETEKTETNNKRLSTEEVAKLIEKYRNKEEEYKKMTVKQYEEQAKENIAKQKYNLDEKNNISSDSNEFKSRLKNDIQKDEKIYSKEKKNDFSTEQIMDIKNKLFTALKSGEISMADASFAVEQLKNGKIPDVIKNKDPKEFE